MTGFSIFLGWAGCAVLAVILYRGYRGHLYRVFPVFYGYCAFVLCTIVLGLVASIRRPQQYGVLYWIIELCSVMWGVGVIAELYNHALSWYPGARRFVQTVLVLLTLGVFIGTIWIGREISVANTLEAEQMLRRVQAALLVLLFLVVVYFDLPLDRNVRGIAIGYSWVVASSIPGLSMRSYLGGQFQRIWEYAQPLEYFVSLTIWCVALWRPVQFRRTARAASEIRNPSTGETKQSLESLRRHVLRSNRH